MGITRRGTTAAVPDRVNQFGRPHGPLGYLAGWIMAAGSTPAQSEIADLVTPLRDRQRVLEIGYGPGRLIKLLTEQTSHAEIVGVDPSTQMRHLATWANRAAVRSGQVRLELGTASVLPFPDDHFDTVLSVNTVQAWPEVSGGLDEARRVLRDGGLMVLSWHSATAPGVIRRRLALDDTRLAEIEDAMRRVFGWVERRVLTHSVAFRARP